VRSNEVEGKFSWPRGDCSADLSAWTLTIEFCPSYRFQVCGVAGLVIAAVLTTILTTHGGLRYWVLTGIVATAIATFLALVMATKILTGEERIIYYHHEIGVMIVVGLFLRIAHQPLLPYLDITILGIGTFLTFGRVGCLMVGCCHGRPYRWGVRYSQQHADAGFPSHLVGVRLFPTQAIESLWVGCTVLIGTYFVWIGRPPGTALAWYVITYDLGRFVFEFARGDAERPYWLGFSQPQWISLLLTGGVVSAEFADVLPLSQWHLAAFVLLVSTMIGVSLWRRLSSASNFELLHPCHIRQIASAIRTLDTANHTATAPPTMGFFVPMACTSLGVRISAGKIAQEGHRIYHYTISGGNRPISKSGAKALAGTISHLSGAEGPEELITGDTGVYHLLIRAPLGANS
jgi:Prolipoprotein diacylglyceryl transferase